MLERRTITASDGEELHAYVGSWESGRPVVVALLPFGSPVGVLSGYLGTLARRANVLTWELRRAAPGESGSFGLRFARHIQDYMDVTHALAVARARLLGFCSGAGMSLAIANAGSGPEIEKIALVSGEYALPPSVCRRSRHQSEADTVLRLASVGLEQAHDLCQRIGRASSSSDDEVSAAAAYPFSSARALLSLSHDYLALQEQDFVSMARSVRVPVHVSVGAADAVVTPESQRIIAEALSDAELYVAPDGDHHAIARPASRLGEEVSRFLMA